MKRILLLVLLAGAVAMARAQTAFDTLSFPRALEKARAGGKHVFVDCYTSWCGPCRVMADEVFPLPAVGEYFNPRFVSVKYDIEKDADGQDLAKRFGITAIPTFLVFRADGSLLHKIVGGGKADTFIQRVEEGFNGDRAYGALRERYEAGSVDKDFLDFCLKTFAAAGDRDVEEVCRRLLEQLPDAEKTAAKYWFIFSSEKLSPARSPNELFLMDRYRDFRANVGAAPVNAELSRRYKNRLLEILKKEDVTPAGLRAMTRRVKKLHLEEAAELHALGRVADALLAGNMDRLVTVCERDLPALPAAFHRYIELSDRFIERSNERQRQKWTALGETLWQSLPANEQGLMKIFLEHVQKKALAP